MKGYLIKKLKLTIIIPTMILLHCSSSYGEKIVLSKEIPKVESEKILLFYDYNNDGKSEIFKVINNYQNICIEEYTDRAFRKKWQSESHKHINEIALGDINNDNILEMVAIADREIYIFIQKDGVFTLDKRRIIQLDKIKFSYFPFSKDLHSGHIRELNKKRGVAIAVGDVDYDNQNEVVFARTFAQSEAGIFVEINIIKFTNNHFRTIGSFYINTSGAQCLKILDLDRDGKNEILIGRYDCVLIYSYDVEKRSFGRLGWIELGVNIGDQRIDIGDINGKRILAQCTKYVTSGNQEHVGKIRIFNFNHNLFSSLKDITPHTPNTKWTEEEIEKVEKLSKSFQVIEEFDELPVSYRYRYNQKYSTIEKLIIGDYNCDNINDIIAVYPKSIYWLEKKGNIEKEKNQDQREKLRSPRKQN